MDFNSPDISHRINNLARKLKGRKFVTIGLTKQDWIYMGVDIAYAAWVEYGRSDPRLFKFLGTSVQTPEIAAILADRDRITITKKITQKLQKLFIRVVVFISNVFDVSYGIAIMFNAALLRLLFSPIGYLESRSRLVRNDLNRFFKMKIKMDGTFIFLSRYKDLITKSFNCKKGVEIIGTILTFMLILPFYNIIVGADFDKSKLVFLWVKDLSQPSLSLSLLLLIIIAFKITISRTGIMQKWITKIDWLLISGLLAFLMLLVNIPSSIIIFATGVIGTQTLIDLGARIRTYRLVGDNLFLKVQGEDTGEVLSSPGQGKGKEMVLPLRICAFKNIIGNKGRRLGQLLLDNSMLFTVPEGVVLTQMGCEKAISSHTEFRESIEPRIRQLLPDPDNGKYAVRSCGLSEDNSQSSLAGKYDTVLNVDIDSMGNAINDVLKSFPEDELSYSIIIQKMAEVDIAGVLFTSSPDNRHLSLIEYTEGLGESLVSGQTVPVQVSIGKWSGTVKVEKNASPKLAALNSDKNQEFFKRLFLIGRLIEKKYGCPQDIEWGYNYSKDKLYIIQTRDITAFTVDKNIDMEQTRLLSKITKDPDSINRRLLWSSSDVVEVVDTPSPFTISLLYNLYSNSGSQGIAMRRLGFSVVKNEESFFESVFGGLYDNVSVLDRNRKPTNYISTLWLILKFKINPHKFFIKPVEQRLARLNRDNASESASSNDPHYLIISLLKKIRTFCNEYYSVAYETTLLANFANKYLKRKPQSQNPDDHSMPMTKTSELFYDLSQLNKNSEIGSFIAKWGHRGINEYDLASPSFSERPEDTYDFARRYEGMGDLLDSANMPKSPETDCKRVSNPDYYQQFIILKELAKDESLKYLHSIKPIIIQLAAALNISPDDFFKITLSELQSLERDYSDKTVQKLIEEAQYRDKELTKLRKISFQDNLLMEDIEFLSGDYFESEYQVSERSGSIKQKLQGTMVSVNKSFEGQLKYISTREDYTKEKGPGDVIVTKHLTPDLVPFFSKASGCISEKGGRLSHAAIVAREMYFPVLVGVKINSREFPEGQPVLVTKDGIVDIKEKI